MISRINSDLEVFRFKVELLNSLIGKHISCGFYGDYVGVLIEDLE